MATTHDLGALIIVAVALFTWLIVANTLGVPPHWNSRIVWGLFDSLAHGFVALVVTYPVIAAKLSTAGIVAATAVLAFLAGTLVDVDHFVAAGALDINAATHLSRRPLTHSITAAVLLGGIVWLLTRDPRLGWVAFAGLASHVLRDATVGTAPLLWPLASVHMSRWTYYVGELGLLLGSYVVR